MKEEKIIWQKDGSEMVLIPSGSFEMRGHFDEGGDEQRPAHTVELDAFYMDTHQVTVRRFKKFVQDSGYDYDDWDDVDDWDDYPMVEVSWYDAIAYCDWTGKRLPTEAEWEYAARGGLLGKRYPWGDDDPTEDKANVETRLEQTTAVGSYPANGYGLYDLVDPVGEWCANWYDRNDYRSGLPKNLPGYGTGSKRVWHGEALFNETLGLRLIRRVDDLPLHRGYYGGGFRCVSDLINTEPHNVRSLQAANPCPLPTGSVSHKHCS